jgi:ribosomal protein S12 methylthiotransferase
MRLTLDLARLVGVLVRGRGSVAHLRGRGVARGRPLGDPPVACATVVAQSFWVETLGCPKNAVDSDKVVASLLADGLVPSARAEDADLVVVNTCAFVEAARQESVDTVLALGDRRKRGARLVVTGCMAERYGDELAEALPEADAVVGFAGEGSLGGWVAVGDPKVKPTGSVPERPAGSVPERPAGSVPERPRGVRDLLELPRPAPSVPWAYLKVAEGCDRACAFCAIPSFRGKQRSRTPESIEAEARSLVEAGVGELVLVAQDLAWYGRDAGEPGSLAPLLRRLDALASDGLARVRLLYLYPSEVRDPLVSTMLELATVVPYFDLSLQHADPRLLRRMKRWGSGDRFLATIDAIRGQEPEAAFRSSFIVGFPGEGEHEHDELLAFLQAASLDWAGFFPFSAEDGTPAASLPDVVAPQLALEWLRECEAVQEPITRSARDALVGREVEVLVDARDDDGDAGGLVGRTHREAPEIDGVVRLDAGWARPGALVRAHVTDALGPDLFAKALPATPIEARATR